MSDAVFDLIVKIILIVGIPTMVAACIYIGRKLQILDDLKGTLKTVKYNLKVVADYLIQETDFSHSDLESYSPLKLTDIGKKRIRDIGFDKIFEEHKQDFFDFINSEKAKTKYDVEVSAIKSLSALFYKDYFNLLKEYLYNKPEIDERQLRVTLGVFVRDEYFKAHPEIK